MTVSQSQALWEMCRQGFPLRADEAEKQWESGRIYQPDLDLHLPRKIAELIDRCNREVVVQYQAA